MASSRVLFAGAVETRFPRSGTSRVRGYHVIHSAGDQYRRFGCSFWINTTIAIVGSVRLLPS
eukprot:7541196-Pyramimonas_sp.AAC.1